MVVISRFRTLWGVDPGPNLSNWHKKIIEWKAHGYAGFEISIYGLSAEELQHLRSIADELDVEISTLIHSYPPASDAPTPSGLTIDDHLKQFRKMIQLSSIVKAVYINAQSGSDSWSWDDSVYFFQQALKIQKEEGFEGRLYHETHRSRSTFTPFATDYILKKIPELEITLDVSHWTCVCERLLETEEEQQLLARVIPRVRHIHARIGTTQSSQCPEPLNPAFTAEREFHEKLWLEVIALRAKADPNRRITWVPEYGPYPYHPIGTAQTYSDLADSEGKRLEALFASFIAKI